MRQLLILTVVLVSLSGLTARYAFSQAPAPTATTTAPPPPADPVVAPTKTVANDGKVSFDDSKYVDPTYANLARLYWALGILDVNKADLIDNFLAITECEMFMTYINNDLEWKEIRNLTRESLRKDYKTFPTHFRIMIPLYLDKYIVEGEYFEVDQKKSAIDSVRNIETVYYTKTVTCGKTGDIEGYPRNLILYLNRPFSLSELPVERELARLFLDETNSKIKKTPDVNRPIKTDSSKRMAFLELMFRVHSFKETANTMGGMEKAVVYAQIDYIRVYADYAKEKLLYQKDMYEESKRKRRKREGPLTGEDLSLPEGPLFGDKKKEE